MWLLVSALLTKDRGGEGTFMVKMAREGWRMVIGGVGWTVGGILGVMARGGMITKKEN